MFDLSKKVYLKCVTPSSTYYKRNLHALFGSDRKNRLSATMEVVRTMMSDEKLMKTIMPRIIGLDANNTNWTSTLTTYWNSYTVAIPDNGKELEVGWKYKTEDDAKKYEGYSNKAHEDYTTLCTSTPLETEKHYDKLLGNILATEGDKLEVATPINPNDYMLWRVALIHSHVANREQDISKSKRIRFFITDTEEIRKRDEVLFRLRTKASRKFYEILAENLKVDAILTLAGEDIHGKTLTEKHIMLEKFMKDKPNEFLSLESDKSLQTKAFIEKCITNSILKRIPNTTTIVNDSNEIIGETLDIAVVNITKETPAAKSLKTTLEAQLKALPV